MTVTETPSPSDATLVQTGAVPPVVCAGTVIASDDTSLVFQLAPGARAPTAGGAAVVDRPGGLRVIGVVDEVTGDRVRVRIQRTAAPDKREFPRVEGAVHVRFHVGDAAAVSAWLAGRPGPGPAWEPEPYMNFSVTGLQFDIDAPVRAEDVLLIALRVPRSERTWRVVGRVVRVDGAADGQRTVAVQFTHLSAGAANALRRHTTRIQKAILG